MKKAKHRLRYKVGMQHCHYVFENIRTDEKTPHAVQEHMQTSVCTARPLEFLVLEEGRGHRKEHKYMSK